MTQQRTTAPARTKTWRLRLDVFEEDEDLTTVRAILDKDEYGGMSGASEAALRATASAQRNPHDPPAPEIGDEYAAGRALLELARQLLRDGTHDAADNAQTEG